MKENRLTAPFLIGPTFFLKSVSSTLGFKFESKSMLILEQTLSWFRLPYVWSTWIFFTPSYLLTIFVDIIIIMVYSVLTKTEAADIRNIELYAYDAFGTSCII